MVRSGRPRALEIELGVWVNRKRIIKRPLAVFAFSNNRHLVGTGNGGCKVSFVVRFLGIFHLITLWVHPN